MVIAHGNFEVERASVLSGFSKTIRGAAPRNTRFPRVVELGVLGATHFSHIPS
jgi:hypothetical protein